MSSNPNANPDAGNGLNPPGNIDSRPDGTDAVDSVDRSDSSDLKPKHKLADDEARRSFGLVLADEESEFAHVREPLDPDETVPLFIMGTGLSMPYQPPEQTNLITTRVTTSFDQDCLMRAYVDEQLQSTVYIDGGGWQDVQIAELAELDEVVSDLDGDHTLSWIIENTSSEPLYGSTQIRTLEQGVDE